ncbi:GNAT domain [Trypanosoma melophagium]|uniref:GNAT domain n=1 Tax=Trypanosoma melophagium TaxID=715481 RepID=UPI00351A4F76|nr:GNAT domain [Trypanosoma melophagium]
MNNEHVLVSGHELRLVPYLAQHVPRYHQWMSDRELLQCTESEPLTLAEEYANQQEWLTAADKITFILLAPLSIVVDASLQAAAQAHGVEEDDVGENKSTHGPWEGGEDCSVDDPDNGSENEEEEEYINEVIMGVREEETISREALRLGEPQISTPFMRTQSEHSITPRTFLQKEEGQIGRTYVMIGDCNLFSINSDDVNCTSSSEKEEKEKAAGETKVDCSGDAKDASAHCSNENDERCFEISVMIAEPLFRRRGLGAEAVRLLLSYALDKLGATTFVAKILNTNNSSIQFFTNKLGFTKLKEVPVFNEVHYYKRFSNNAEKEAWMAEVGYKLDVYDEAAEQSMTVLHSFPGSR